MKKNKVVNFFLKWGRAGKSLFRVNTDLCVNTLDKIIFSISAYTCRNTSNGGGGKGWMVGWWVESKYLLMKQQLPKDRQNQNLMINSTKRKNIRWGIYTKLCACKHEQLQNWSGCWKVFTEMSWRENNFTVMFIREYASTLLGWRGKKKNIWSHPLYTKLKLE